MKAAQKTYGGRGFHTSGVLYVLFPECNFFIYFFFSGKNSSGKMIYMTLYMTKNPGTFYLLKSTTVFTANGKRRKCRNLRYFICRENNKKITARNTR